MLMAHQHALTGTPHAILVIVVLQSLQSRLHGGVLLGLRLLCPEGVVGQRVESDRRWLLGIERLGDDWTGFTN